MRAQERVARARRRASATVAASRPRIATATSARRSNRSLPRADMRTSVSPGSALMACAAAPLATMPASNAIDPTRRASACRERPDLPDGRSADRTSATERSRLARSSAPVTPTASRETGAMQATARRERPEASRVRAATSARPGSARTACAVIRPAREAAIGATLRTTWACALSSPRTMRRIHAVRLCTAMGSARPARLPARPALIASTATNASRATACPATRPVRLARPRAIARRDSAWTACAATPPAMANAPPATSRRVPGSAHRSQALPWVHAPLVAGRAFAPAAAMVTPTPARSRP